MFKILKCSLNSSYFLKRTFLSQAYYCNEIWEHRLQDPIIKNVNLDDMYHELDQRFNKSKNINAIDVDIFANAVRDESFSDELTDLIYKLRSSANTMNTLNSTSHAVVRNLFSFGKTEQLLNILDDRLNYGVFLDHFAANLLLNTYWNNKDYSSGVRVASQLMLQEDTEHPLCKSLSLLHCYNFLLEPKEWPKPPASEEPEEEVKIRVKYLRNPFDDEHFDLKDPIKIVGKTLSTFTRNPVNVLERSLHLVGLGLYGNSEKLSQFMKHCKDKKIYKEVLMLLPEGNQAKIEATKLQTESGDLQKLLQDQVTSVAGNIAERDIASQCQVYLQWEEERKQTLEKQKETILQAARLVNIEKVQKGLQEKEQLLWFFENQENIELKIEAKEISALQSETDQIKMDKADEEYIPPEVAAKPKL